MPIKIKGNSLLLRLVLIYGAFFAIGPFLVRPNLSNGTAIAALIAGAIMAARYSGEAYKVLFQGKRGKDGAHFAILGVAELGYGLAYSGCYRLLWNFMGQPQSWIGSTWSCVGLLMIAKGAYWLATTPDEVSPPFLFPNGFKMVALLAFGVIIGVVLGVNLSNF